MKHLLLISSLILLSICFNSCNNSIDGIEEPNPTDDGSLSFKANGQTVEFKFTTATIGTETVTGFTIFTLNGFTEAASDFFVMTFFLPSNEVLTETSYNTIDNSCDIETDICGGLGYGYFNSDGVLVAHNTTPGGTSEITFSEIKFESGGIAKGTFSGELFGANNSKLTISDGKFTVNID